MNLHFDSLGHGDDVVWLHGWAMNGAVWRDVAGLLADDACHHLVDLPGHGRSAADAPLSLAMMVDALDAAFPFPVHVVGWSLGGAVAAAWAARSPDKLRSLTLVASSPCFMQRPDWRSAMPEKTLAQFATSLGDDWRGTLKRFISLQAMGDEAARAVARRLGDELFEHGEPALDALGEGLAILRDTDLRAEVAALDLPVLLQFGDRDTLTPLPAGAWLAQTLPQAEFVVHRGAAHVPFVSHRDAFVSAQRRFLASI
ncbi:pimeloyl-ACP methyl ester esterase BioH [Jeongeupia chitinilytica]|uniref:Pimeloyl-[acyl-carrier protein] methyl ester esterase n=1 Tax=Jeongeupia chitinilytica TaxID=1041641 RepID=A0ABQ3H470_9NEIS|nr:pimeloyl-ACP methyl ester esterase BioH [Jeongeupia chitinilytica]GHD67247.1 pimeloyl-[acyl-carrier protein] methyl ester esterase [Jeongeupia chitinilytica]